MTKDFSVAPYFDDFDKNNNFLKVLFQPGRPVQTRELNQLQSILQNQVTSVGDHLFKNGSMIIPGHIYYDNTAISLKLTALNNSGVSTDILLPNLLNTVLRNANGVSAVVLYYALSTGESDSYPTIFVKYVSGSEDGTQTTFNDSDVIYDVDNSNLAVQLSVNAAGESAIATVNDGIFYINGNFVNVSKQTVVLSAASSTPSLRVGLNIIEEFISESDDDTLYDNALGYSNYAAPGAHRYKITLVLETRSFDYDDAEEGDIEKFVDLLHVKNGEIVMKVNATKYAELERIFARRTFDESGDYEVEPHEVSFKEYRNNNRGDWTSNTVYLVGDVVSADSILWVARSNGTSGGTSPLAVNINHSDGGVKWVQFNRPFYNDGIYDATVDETLATQSANASKLVYEISPGKAYIKGYEIENQGTQFLTAEKAITADYDNSEIIPVKTGTWVRVKNLAGLPNIDECEKVEIFADISATNYTTKDVQAVATYTVTGGVITGVTITEGGAGYNQAYLPTITAPTGTGAVFKATVSAAGQITAIKILSGGTGYTNGSLTIAAPAEKPIGTCRIRSIEYHSGTVGSSTAEYNVQIMAVEMKGDYKLHTHAKSIRSAGMLGFTGELITRNVQLIGTTATTSASKELVGTATTYKSIDIGSTIVIGGVKYKLASVVSNLEAHMLTAVSSTNAAITIFTEQTFVSHQGHGIMPLPREFIKTVRDEDGLIQTSYTVKRRFDSVSVSGNELTLNLTVDGELFIPNYTGAYVVADQDTKTILTYTTVSAAGQLLTISGLSLASGTVEVIATITKEGSAAREKVKTLTTKVMDITDVNILQATQIQLSEADVYRLVKVYKVDGAGVATGGNYPAIAAQTLIDITKDYKFDDGQTLYYYNLGSLIRNSNVVTPNNTIRVIFEYFEHSNGDYFSIDSYPDLTYTQIKPFLRDSLDFRPRISDSGTEFLVSSGASIPEPMVADTYFQCDYGYYLPRVDIISLDKNGTAFLSSGEPGYGFKKPNVNRDDSMVLATTKLLPGPHDINSATVELFKTSNKRYTMKDISQLESRIDSLEYYTQLTALENKTLSENVLDQNGLDRFKSGLLADNFDSFNSIDMQHDDNLVTLDTDSGECRSFVEAKELNLVLSNTSAAAMTTDHYARTGSCLTLPWTRVIAVEQPLASRAENINPFSVVKFGGDLTLQPQSDSWIETQFEDELPTKTGQPVVRNKGKFTISWSPITLRFTSGGDKDNFVDSSVGGLDEGLSRLNSIGASNINISGSNGGRSSGTFEADASSFDSIVGAWAASRGDGGTLSMEILPPDPAQFVTHYTPTTSTADRPDNAQVVRTHVIPFARTRPVSFKLESGRPLSIYSAKLNTSDIFNNIDMALDYTLDSYSVLPLGFEFLNTVDPESNAVEMLARTVTVNKLRQYTNVSYIESLTWDRGESVVQFASTVGGTTSATGVVMAVIDDNGKKVLKIVNITGTFDKTKALYVVRSSSYVLVANSTSIDPVTPTKVKTDRYGSAYGVAFIPCNTNFRVNSGSIIFALDNSIASDEKPQAGFISHGIQEVVRKETKPIKRSASLTSNRAGIVPWRDPLAQTFMLNESSDIIRRDNNLQSSTSAGLFIEAVGLYFKNRDSYLPVTVQIRTVENGYPSGNVIVSTTLYAWQVQTSSDSTVETTVEFDDPVFLEYNTEYAIVLLTNSLKYEVWIARMGEAVVGSTTQVITSQPTLGSLFKSQNSSTWTAEQLEDLKFKIYRMKFDKSKAGLIQFENRSLGYTLLKPNCLYAKEGSTSIWVYHDNHGFDVGDKTTIINYSNGPFSSGLSLTDATVSYVEYDRYRLDGVGLSAAAYTGYFGGTSISSKFNYQYSTATPFVNTFVPINTDMDINLTTMTSDYVRKDQVSINNNENQHYTEMMKIASSTNASTFIPEAVKRSMLLNIAITSQDDRYSPVININNVYATLMRNKINNPTKAINFDVDEVSVGDDLSLTFDQNTTSDSIIEFSGAAYTAAEAALDGLTVGKYISIRTPTAVTASVNIGKDYLVTEIDKNTDDSKYTLYVDGSDMTDEPAALGKTANVVILNRYIDELAPIGTTVFSTLVEKPMTLKVPSTGIRVTLDLNLPFDTEIEVWYKSSPANSDIILGQQRWYKMESALPIINTRDFRAFTEHTFEITGLDSFDMCQVKVVFRATNTALTPRIKNFRLLALA